MKGMQRLSLIAALCVVLLFAASPAVALDGTVYVTPWCGDVEVPAGTPIVLQWAWRAHTEELVDLFRDSGNYFLAVDREPIRNTRQYWGPSFEVDYLDGSVDNQWMALWEYPLGMLEVGETHRVSSLYFLWREITDGFDNDAIDSDENGLPAMYGPGPLEWPPWRCTVTRETT